MLLILLQHHQAASVAPQPPVEEPTRAQNPIATYGIGSAGADYTPEQYAYEENDLEYIEELTDKNCIIGDFIVAGETPGTRERVLGIACKDKSTGRLVVVKSTKTYPPMVDAYGFILKNSGFVDPKAVRAFELTKKVYKLSPVVAVLGATFAGTLSSNVNLLKPFSKAIIGGALAVPLEEALKYLEEEKPVAIDQDRKKKKD